MPVGNKRKPYVKVYHGYGHAGNLVVYGHVFRKEPHVFREIAGSWRSNFIQLLKLFFVRPIPDASLVLRFYGQEVRGKTEYDGFFRFEWEAAIPLSPGWHEVTVDYLDPEGKVLHTNTGAVFVPHATQFAFISDIDDTVMKSYSATVFRRLRELLAKHPDHREIFGDTVNHYRYLTLAHTPETTPNPVFYVSSSEWNLYDYLRRIFLHNHLPEGVFLLNQVKKWYQLFTTGKSGHDGKLMRISRILQAFPDQKIVLIGDNTQRDPYIYKAIAEKHPQQIFAIYIRNVRPARTVQTRAVLSALENTGVHVCFFSQSSEAIRHGRHIGLIDG